MLTVEERREHTTKGLCFNCDESYAPGHKCKGRLFRIDADRDCLVELIEQTGNEEATELEESVITTEISPHAFSGTFNPRTIRVKGWIQGRPLSILIDSGSTHNFIQAEVATRLGYGMQELPTFKVFIGSGEYLVCKEVCRQVSISIQNTDIVEDLFVLAMGGANVVLGIQWLGKLGLVTTDRS